MSSGIKQGAKLFAALALIWGSSINIYLAFSAISPYRVPIIIRMHHVAHWITLISVVIFFLTLIFYRSRWLLIWLTPGMIAFGLWYLPAWLPKSTPQVDGFEFTTATFNVYGFIADPDQTFAVIQAMDADLIALQELRPTLEQKLKTDLADQYPFQISKVVQGYDGLALLSRFPILEHEIYIQEDLDHLDFTAPHYLRAIIDLDGQAIVVYVIHPPIPQPSPDVRPITKMLMHYDDENLQVHIERIVALIQAETLPVLLLCDCNSTPRSRQYPLLNGVLDEAFRAQGWGFGLTHPADPFPLIRIDYIWYSADFTPLEAKVWAETGTSDHHPLWARLVSRP